MSNSEESNSNEIKNKAVYSKNKKNDSSSTARYNKGI